MNNVQDVQEIESTAIWLKENSDDVLHTFHCPECGYILFQHVRGVELIIPEETISFRDFKYQYGKGRVDGMSATPPIIIRCKQCKKQYNIR